MRLIIFMMLLVSLVIASSAYAQVDTTPTPFSNTQMCIQNTAGFDDNGRPLPNPPNGFRSRLFAAVIGYSHLNDDGLSATSEWQSTAANLDNNFTYGGEGSCTGPITRQADGSLFWAFDCQSRITYGDNAGTTQTYHGGTNVHYIVDATGIAVTHNASPPTVERVDAIPPVGAPYTFYRLCSRAGTSGALPLP